MSAAGQRRAARPGMRAGRRGSLGHHEFQVVCSGSGREMAAVVKMGFRAGGQGKRESKEGLLQLSAPPPPARLSQACWPLHGHSRVPSFMSCGRRRAQGISLGEGMGVWKGTGCVDPMACGQQSGQSVPSDAAALQRRGRAPCSHPPALAHLQCIAVPAETGLQGR